jgi:hypothetical protein
VGDRPAAPTAAPNEGFLAHERVQLHEPGGHFVGFGLWTPVEEMLERLRVDARGDGEQRTSFEALFGDEGRFRGTARARVPSALAVRA